MKVLFILALVAIASAHFEYTQEFQEWKVKYSRKYGTKDEELQRQIIWESNKKFVENHNANADKFGFTVAMNEFADLDSAEFASIYNGILPQPANYNSTRLHKVSGNKLEASVDWRQKGAVTPIKNQGKCGSCWSFSTTGSLEGQHFLKTGQLVSLSEQQLMDCSTSFGNHGCKGGLMQNAFRYLETVAGDESEEDYPYLAEDSICRYKPSLAVAGCKGYVNIPRGDENALKDAASTVGPISVAIDAGHTSFQLYHSGVYYYSGCSSTRLDHGVLVVGYGSYESDDYWLVKNSWGTRWGMDGYIMMARNKDNNCGIATSACYPTGVN